MNNCESNAISSESNFELLLIQCANGDAGAISMFKDNIDPSISKFELLIQETTWPYDTLAKMVVIKW
jgi:hypothetical protein